MRGPRYGLVLWFAGVLTLTGCGGTRVGYLPTPPDPPPIPARKPTPPAVAAAPVSTAQLAPAKVVAAPAAPVKLAATYRVRAGDTVYGVARRFGVPLRGVIDANGLRPPYALNVGQALKIREPRRHVVAKGETVYGLSRRYGVDLTQLVRLNRIKTPYKIAPGQTLVLPVAGRAPGTQTAALTPPTKRATAAPAPRKTAGAVRIPEPPPRAGGKFLWPVRGKLITRYGPKKGGAYNDGINIAAPRGTPVRAAENGVVAYIGNELRGFGNLILIKHAGGWITAYAHTDASVVRRGERVKRGQVIARIGTSGNVSTPQLHFEIRRGTRAVDPAGLLGPQRAAAG